MKSPFRNVRVWRASFHRHTDLPILNGKWQMGDWRKEKFASCDTVVEERIIPFSQIHSVKIAGGRLYVEAHKLRTMRSRKSSVYFRAMLREPYDGDVLYPEGTTDE